MIYRQDCCDRAGAGSPAAGDCCRKSTISCPRPIAAESATRPGAVVAARRAAARPTATPTRWTPSSTRPWYQYRYLSLYHDTAPFDPAIGNTWLPVDTVHRRRRARHAAPARTRASGPRRCAIWGSVELRSADACACRTRASPWRRTTRTCRKSRGNVVVPGRPGGAATEPMRCACSYVHRPNGTRAARGARGLEGTVRFINPVLQHRGRRRRAAARAAMPIARPPFDASDGTQIATTLSACVQHRDSRR